MTSVIKLSCFLCAITALSVVVLPTKSIQHSRIQLQDYVFELYADLRQHSGAPPTRVNYIDESPGLLALTVYADPVYAKIEIEEIEIPYHAEMLLPEGSYKIVARFSGGGAQSWTHKLQKGNQVFYAKH